MTFKSEDDVWSALRDVFRDVFDDDDIDISPETTAADIDDWDSLTNIQLLVAIEQQSGIRFSSAEVADVPNVGELVALILKHSSEK